MSRIRMTPIDIPKWTENSQRRLKSTQRTVGKRGKLRLGETDFSRKEYTNMLFNAKRSTPKIYTQITLYILSRLNLYMYMHINIMVKSPWN